MLDSQTLIVRQVAYKGLVELIASGVFPKPATLADFKDQLDKHVKVIMGE